MIYALSIAAVCGALAVFLTLPHRISMAKIGGLIGAASLGLFLGWIARQSAGAIPSVYYYLFTAIAAAAAVRVISHPRPVYSALYFVLVVLSTCGLLVMLEAEFMAFAMVIIYAGAILVTYMFVIMLATEPRQSNEPESSPAYDREARRPLLAVFMGFTLLTVVGAMIFDPNSRQAPHHPDDPIAALRDVAKVADFSEPRNRQRFTDAMRELEMIAPNEDVSEINLDAGRIDVRPFDGAKPRYIPIDGPDTQRLLAIVVPNIDRVGLNLFKGHTLGIELAAVILLLSMVGAIVIAKRIVPEAEVETT